MKPGSTYYAGAVRVLVEGVPSRMARKPSATNLADLRAWEKYRVKPLFDSRAEKAAAIARDARDAIKAYAEALEISEAQAKARIAAQRHHLLAHPDLDLSLEYDL